MAQSENIAETNQISQSPGTVLTRFTVEHGLYALIAIVAGLLRFTELDSLPLSPTEAEEALNVWNLWQLGGISQLFGSPLYHSITAILSQVAGFSDTAMRLVPALFGWATILLPWFLRHRSGRLGALITSLLLALSPLLTLTSRTAGGEAIAIFAGFLTFVSWLRFQETSENKWFYVLVVSFSLGLLTTPLYYGFLFTLAIGWLAQSTVGPAVISDEHGNRKSIVLPNRQVTKNSLLLALAIFIVAGTAVFFSPAGIGAGANLAVDWLGQFWSSLDSNILVRPFAALFRFEIALVLLGLPAVIWAARRDLSFPLFLVYWAVAGLLLILLQRGSISNLLIIAIPGYLLIGRFINDIIAQSSRWYYLSFAGMVIVAGAIVLVNLGRFSRLGTPQGSDFATYYGLLIVVSLVVLFLVVAIIWSWDQKLVPAGLAVGLLFLILVYYWGTGWWISHDAANDTREEIIDIGTEDDLPRIAGTLSELSWELTNSADGLNITSTIDSPSLRWYLRDYEVNYVGGTLSRDANSQAIITAEDRNPNLATGYVGTDFAYLRSPSAGQRQNVYQKIRWWLFHESSVPIEQKRAILWLRSDLLGIPQS